MPPNADSGGHPCGCDECKAHGNTGTFTEEHPPSNADSEARYYEPWECPGCGRGAHNASAHAFDCWYAIRSGAVRDLPPNDRLGRR